MINIKGCTDLIISVILKYVFQQGLRIKLNFRLFWNYFASEKKIKKSLATLWHYHPVYWLLSNCASLPILIMYISPDYVSWP